MTVTDLPQMFPNWKNWQVLFPDFVTFKKKLITIKQMNEKPNRPITVISWAELDRNFFCDQFSF